MRSAAAVSLVAVLALSAASCSLPGSGGGDDPAATAPPAGAPASEPAASAPASAASPAASTPPADPTAAAPTPADPNQPPAGDQLGQVVATRTSASDGDKVVLRLYPVQRDQTTSHVNLTLSSGSASSTDSVSINQMLSDGNSSSSDKSPWTADGLQLVDGKNSKLYLVASDGQGQCVCSRELIAVRLKNGAPVLISGTFAAPPADVTSVDVRIPSFGVVKNVPVQ